jgi:hypothetical protein
MPSKSNKKLYLDRLMEIAELANGLSGRMLRKMPLKAYALCLQQHPVPLWDYLDAMHSAVRSDINNKENLNSSFDSMRLVKKPDALLPIVDGDTRAKGDRAVISDNSEVGATSDMRWGQGSSSGSQMDEVGANVV